MSKHFHTFSLATRADMIERQHSHSRLAVSTTYSISGCYAEVFHALRGGEPVDTPPQLRSLSIIYSPPHMRGEGYASQLMDAICADADASAYDLRLHAVQLSRCGLDARELRHWCMQFGFQPIHSSNPSLMQRSFRSPR